MLRNDLRQNDMLKFMVVIYRRPDLTHEQFRRHLQEVHGPLAKNLPGLRKYIQNIVRNDAQRKAPGWDAIVELYFDDWSSMEAAWASPQGAASDADLPAFADLTRTTWSVVDAITMLEYQGAGVKTRK
ncbi:MAG: EthD domain-containing protein [Candidatus Sulfotelmatobacter sp.]